MAKKQAGAKYIGGGDFLNGVPARDMSADEWEALDPEQQKQAVKLGLFEVGIKPADKESE